jgi:GT2 family glycosyltransferase
VKHELRETGGNPVRFNVVIATHGRDTLLERTLRSLASASIPSGFECVFVVENGIVAGARAICDALGPALAIEYRHVERPGKGRAVQHALDEIGSGFVLFLDDDVRVGEALLTCYADELARSGPGCFLGGPLAIDYETEPPAWLHKHLPRSVTGWRLRSTSARLEGAARFLGANFGAFVEDVAAVGGFSMVLGPGALIAGAAGNPTGLELDLQDRLLAAGCEGRYVAGAEVWHYVPADRCDVAWALHRTRRNAFSEVVRGRISSPGTGRAPASEWLRLGLANLRLAVGGREPEARFPLAKYRAKVLGRIEGHRFQGAGH